MINVPEKHRAIAHAWVDGAEIEELLSNGEWYRTYLPDWVALGEYRIKPKAKVKKWRWIAEDTDGVLFISRRHHSEAGAGCGFIQKIDSTMIEADE